MKRIIISHGCGYLLNGQISVIEELFGNTHPVSTNILRRSGLLTAIENLGKI